MPLDHYATLGLDRGCTVAQVRAAYRVLVREHHPDLHPDSRQALARSQELNEAHAVLSDPVQRRNYDRDRDAAQEAARPPRSGRIERNISHDVQLRIEDFLRGTSLEVRVKDPGNSAGPEIYQLHVPPMTPAGARLRIPRRDGGFVAVRLRPAPNFRFKARGADLRCDLRINARLAGQGGTERISGPLGDQLRVPIAAGVKRGETVRIAGEGLPKPRGGRGDLLVRITYRPEVRVTRSR